MECENKNEEADMRREYDIDKLNPRPNPYAKELKKECNKEE